MASMRSCFKVGGFKEILLRLGDIWGNLWLMVPEISPGCLALTRTFGVEFNAENFFVIVLEQLALRRCSNISVRLTPSIACRIALDLQRPLI